MNMEPKGLSRRMFMRKIALGAGAVAFEATLGYPRAVLGEQARGAYDSTVDPIAPGAGIRRIAEEVRAGGGSQTQMLQRLFDRLRVGASGGLTAVTSARDTRPPNTAEQAISRGGDCTEFAFVALSAMQLLGIPCGARVVRLQGSAQGSEHMIAYATVNGRETIIDPQAAALGQSARPVERVVMGGLTPSRAAAMYHREWGNHLSARTGRESDAVSAFNRALELNADDAYSHHRLARLLERRAWAGDQEAAVVHDREAARLDPSNQLYRRNTVTVGYNESLRLAQEAGAQGRFADCVTHLQDALESGERLSASDRQMILDYQADCRRMAGQ